MRNQKRRYIHIHHGLWEKDVKMLIKSKCWEESQNAVLNLIVENWWRNSPGIIFPTSFSAFCLYSRSAWRKKKSLLISPLMVGPITMLEWLPFLDNFCWIKKKRRILQALAAWVLYWCLFMFCLVHFITQNPKETTGQDQSVPASSVVFLFFIKV